VAFWIFRVLEKLDSAGISIVHDGLDFKNDILALACRVYFPYISSSHYSGTERRRGTPTHVKYGA
jgi:hypothetical protein